MKFEEWIKSQVEYEHLLRKYGDTIFIKHDGEYQRFEVRLANRFVKDLANWVKPKMSDKRLKLEVEFYYPDKRVRDLDNNLKPLIDGLVKCGLCLDDEQFDELHIKRGEFIKGGLIKIKVFEIV